MNRHFVEMLSACIAEHVEFLVVGAHAMAAHGVPRATGDIDIWVRPTKDNAERVWRALKRFGAPLSGVSAADFEQPDVVFQIGVPPFRVDVLTSIDGVDFESAWSRRSERRHDDLEFAVLGLADLIANKRATDRPKDRVDVGLLERRG